MRMFFERKKISIFVSWFLSYVIILLLPLFISSYIYFEAINIVKNQINSSNKILLNQVQQTIDNSIEELLKLGIQIGLNPNIQSAMYSPNEISLDDRYLFSQINKQMRSYNVTNNFLDYLYVYFKNKDVVVAYDTFSSGKDFFQNTYLNKSITLEAWENLMRNNNKIQYIPITSKKSEGKDREVQFKEIAYIQPLPVGGRVSSYGTIVMHISEENINNILIERKLIKEGDVFIINEDNQIIASTSRDLSLPSEINYSSFNGDNEIEYFNWNNSKVVVSSVVSGKVKWKYVSVIPEDVFMKKVRYINQLTVIVICFCLISGVFIAYFFTKKNYNPVRNLVKKISNTLEVSVEKSSDEFSFIEKSIENELAKRKVIDEKLKQQNYMLRYNFLVKLFRGTIDGTSLLKEELEAFEINFKSNQFSVMLFHIEDLEGFFSKSNEEISMSEKTVLVEFVLTKVIEEITNAENNVFIFEIDGLIACLVNFSTENTEENKNEVFKLAEDAQKFIQSRMHILFSVSISDVHEELSGISSAYREARQAMEYKIIKNNSSIINYNEIKEYDYKYDYSLETEHRLMNFVKIGDYEKAEQVLKEVFNKNFYNNKLSIQMIKCIMFDIMSTIVKTIVDMESINDFFIDEINPIERLVQCETIKELQIEILTILKKVCEYTNKNKNKHSVVLKDQVMEFIKNNYYIVDLDLTMIANEFKLNSSYLSTLFKENSGQGLLEYINKVRIEKAKVLLKEKGAQVSEIASRTGFYNSNAFIRTFKKYEGITPGKYKEMD